MKAFNCITQNHMLSLSNSKQLDATLNIWNNFEPSVEICHMNMSQQCDLLGMVSLQQDKP